MEMKPTVTANKDDSCPDGKNNFHGTLVCPEAMESKPNRRQWILKALEARYLTSVEGEGPSSHTTSPQCVKDLIQPRLDDKKAKEKLVQIEKLLFKLTKKDGEYLDEAKLTLGLKDLTARLVRRRLRRARQTPLPQKNVGFRSRIPILPPLTLSGFPVNRKFTKFASVKQEEPAGEDKK